MNPETLIADLLAQLEMKDRLIVVLAEKLATVAEHLGRLAERKDRRSER